jgi:hypothetical protein
MLFSIHSAAFAQAEKPKATYDFSLPREEKIKLAESAAPPEISGKATVYILERSGYVKVRDGSNGFSCFVDRQDPLNLEPTCFDAEGSATTLQSRFLAEELRAKGKSEDEVTAAIAEGYKSGKFRAAKTRDRLHDVRCRIPLRGAVEQDGPFAGAPDVLRSVCDGERYRYAPGRSEHAAPDPGRPTGRGDHRDTTAREENLELT